MNPEKLPQTEPKYAHEQPLVQAHAAETQTAQEISEQRSAMLKNLRSHISRKLYFLLEEKLHQEKLELELLLGQKNSRQKAAARFSNILDTQYFEQLLLD